MAAIAGLEAFGLTRNGLARLGRRTCVVEISLRTYEVTPAVRRRVPAERHGYLGRRVDRWIQSLRHTYPNLHFRVSQGAPLAASAPSWSSFPRKLTVSVPARDVLKLAAAAGVGHVWLSKIAGCRRRAAPRQPLEWFCVHGLVAIQVEGQTAGMQTVEDRFVLVRAASFEDASRRLRREWRAYAEPYVNPEGELVSWRLERIVDVYSTGETQVRPDGFEVYSRLRQRRIRQGSRGA